MSSQELRVWKHTYKTEPRPGAEDPQTGTQAPQRQSWWRRVFGRER
jgi:hypothetical protein